MSDGTVGYILLKSVSSSSSDNATHFTTFEAAKRFSLRNALMDFGEINVGFSEN